MESMVNDLISRRALIKAYSEECGGYCSYCDHSRHNIDGYSCALIDDAPAVDAVPVIHGRWKYHDPDQHGNRKPYCSNCGEYHLTSWSDYVRCKICPNCGAKMDGGGGE